MKNICIIVACLLLFSCTSAPINTSRTVCPTFDLDGPFTSEAGIEYIVLTAGQGRSAVAAKHIKARNITITRRGSDVSVIDDSFDCPQPLIFSMEEIMLGWNIAFRRMKEGDVWLVKIPPELAYGEIGHPPEIAPNESLYCVINLVEIID